MIRRLDYLDVPSSKEGKVFACQTFTDHLRVQRYHLFMAAKKLRTTVTDGQAVRCATHCSPGQARHLKDDNAGKVMSQTTTVSMWRLTGRRRPEKSLRRVTTLTLLA